MGGGGEGAERGEDSSQLEKLGGKEKSSVLHRPHRCELWGFRVTKGEKRWRRQERVGGGSREEEIGGMEAEIFPLGEQS